MTKTPVARIVVAESRKLAAIVVFDVVGYSRLASADEERILAGCARCAAI